LKNFQYKNYTFPFAAITFFVTLQQPKINIRNMKKHNPRQLLLLLMIILITGCFYVPDGEHFVELNNQKTLPEIEVNLNFVTDTVYIARNDWIRFRITNSTNKVNWAMFKIGDKETSVYSDKEGAFQFDWYFGDLHDGTYLLSMFVHVRSGTNSIADLTGAEGYVLQYRWTLVITDRFSIGQDITNFRFENGFLMVEWERYKGVDFQKYELWKEVIHTPNAPYLVATVSNQQQTSVADYTYHGEKSRYFIRVNDFYWHGLSIDAEGPLPAVTSANNSKGDIVLRWEIPPYYSTLRGYRVSFPNPDTGELTTQVEISNAMTDSCIITNSFFGYEYDFYLTPLASSNNYLGDWELRQFLSSRVKASLGLPSPTFVQAESGLDNRIFIYQYNYVEIFDTDRMEVIQTIEKEPGIRGFCVSALNNFLLGFLENPTQIYLHDFNEPEKSKTIDFSGKLPWIKHLAAVADNGTGAVVSEQEVVLVDFKNETILSRAPIRDQNLFACKISPSGNMVIIKTYAGWEFFRYNGKTLEELPGFFADWQAVSFAGFLTGETDKLVQVKGKVVEVTDCHTLITEHRWNIEGTGEPLPFHPDPDSGKLLLRQDENLVLLNTDTGEYEIIGKNRDSYNSRHWNFVYNNNQVFWSQGKRLPLATQN
jgi:hypothetical protein